MQQASDPVGWQSPQPYLPVPITLSLPPQGHSEGQDEGMGITLACSEHKAESKAQLCLKVITVQLSALICCLKGRCHVLHLLNSFSRYSKKSTKVVDRHLSQSLCRKRWKLQILFHRWQELVLSLVSAVSYRLQSKLFLSAELDRFHFAWYNCKLL